MKNLRFGIASILVVAALLSIIIPLPMGNTDHLLSVAEAQGSSLTIYSGRNENLVGPIVEQFEQDTGIEVEVIYAGTTELALQILEEGENSPADVFFAQDGGALGLLSEAGLLDSLPTYILDSVDPRFRSAEGEWVGVSGRARVVAYNTNALSPEDLPASILDLTAPEWAGRVGWAPTNASLHAHLTAIRLAQGEDVMRGFISGLIANGSPEYSNNGGALAAVIAGEIDAAIINHYYLFAALRENPDAPAANFYFPTGDIGNLVNIAGAGILESSDSKPLAQQFVAFMLSRTAQTYFAENTYEYPLLLGMEADERLLPLDELDTPDFDLSDLADLETTLEILDELRNQ